ncbi:hypothetical protein Tco_1190841, partial [Tanacetum coccineum]
MISGGVDDDCARPPCYRYGRVPAGPTRQEGDAVGVIKEASMAPGGGDEDEEMPQAVPPPPRTQGERIARLEEVVHGLLQLIVTSLARLMDRDDVPYTSYSESSIEYLGRTKQRTCKTSTFTSS